MDAALLRRVEQQRVAMLYGNTLAVSGSALLMAALIAVIAWPHASQSQHLAWCGAVLVQAGVQWLLSRYRTRRRSRQPRPRAWGRHLAITAGVAGVIWGSAAFVLVDSRQIPARWR